MSRIYIITELDEIRNLYIAPTSKIFKKHERAAQIRSAEITDKQVHDITGSDVPWGKNRLVVKYTLSRLKSDIKSRVIRLSASPPVNTPTMGARGVGGGGGSVPVSGLLIECPARVQRKEESQSRRGATLQPY